MRGRELVAFLRWNFEILDWYEYERELNAREWRAEMLPGAGPDRAFRKGQRKAAVTSDPAQYWSNLAAKLGRNLIPGFLE